MQDMDTYLALPVESNFWEGSPSLLSSWDSPCVAGTAVEFGLSSAQLGVRFLLALCEIV